MRSRIHAFRCALNGLIIAFDEEPHFKFHVVATVLVVIAGVLLQVDTRSWLILALAVGLVMSTELLNTAIENICDFLTTEQHPAIKRIKDVAAGAVLVSSITAVVIAVLVFGPLVMSF
ncbi:MAG: diacylglycerol kinase family protein [Bacteroidota bacterium]